MNELELELRMIINAMETATEHMKDMRSRLADFEARLEVGEKRVR